MILSVFWGSRPCELADCAEATANSLELLHSYSPDLIAWFEKGSPKPDVTKPVLPSDIARIHEVLERGCNRNDRNGEPIPELGYRMALWNGDRKSSASVSVQCGSTSNATGIKNSFVFEIAKKFSNITEVESDLLHKLISVWNAKSGRIIELSVLESGDLFETVLIEV